MSKNKSSDSLVKITHGENIETLDLKDKIDLLTSMLENPQKMNRKVYQAKNFYDKYGQLNSENLEYQLVGAATLTSLPITLIFGSAIIGSLIKGVNVPQNIVLASGTFLALEGILTSTACASMTIKGAKMSPEIREKLTINLQELGYQVNSPKQRKQSNIDFTSMITSLTNEISLCKYPNYEEDINILRLLHTEWIEIYGNSLAIKGTKPEIPSSILERYLELRKTISKKINQYRYRNNNERLLTGEVIGGLNNKYISLIEEDGFILKVRNLIDEILSLEYEGFADDIEELKELANQWLAANIKNYRDKGIKLDSSLAPIYSYTEIEQRVRSKSPKLKMSK